jgi:hypothetical protein
VQRGCFGHGFDICEGSRRRNVAAGHQNKAAAVFCIGNALPAGLDDILSPSILD